MGVVALASRSLTSRPPQGQFGARARGQVKAIRGEEERATRVAVVLIDVRGVSTCRNRLAQIKARGTWTKEKGNRARAVALAQPAERMTPRAAQT